ncbi:MAG: Flap-structured DNA-binding and RNA-binding protein [Vezdaea aestivalis]|nr:MAG: Flap-structured DNA-binding and RNA-binding protein [Vezdaea aestivalis]
MSASHVIGNRNSTPEVTGSSLRPPRTLGSAGHHLRASADMASYTSSPQSSRIRPSSEVYYGQSQQGGTNNAAEHEASEKAALQWIADIDQSENTLEEMAEATLDQDFKDELSAIEQWFKVLSEAERTAALYALLQQTTQIQIRFFIQVLQQMGKSHPMSGVLSPASFDKDPMANRLSDAMNKHNVEGSRNSLVRPPPSPGAKRMSGLDPSTINAMFPDAAAAIATQKAAYTQKTGILPASNRNSAIYENRMSLNAPTISAPSDAGRDSLNQPPASPWGVRPAEQQQQPIARPKSSSEQPMGKFTQPPPSAGLRATRPQQISSGSTLQNTTVNAPDRAGADMSVLSPYNPGINWASNMNTPMTSNFQQNPLNQADMVANATAMKLAALSTVNNRIALDDVKKYRRGRSNDGGQGPLSPGLVPNIPGTSVVMVNENGQVLNAEQVAAMQARSAGTTGNAFGQMNLGLPQNNGFLSAYDGAGQMLANSMNNLNLGYSLAPGNTHDGYLSDHSDIARGRSPRGRRGSSKPPEDPTDPNLLQDIPGWLRSLRLHKYTDNLKDMKWTELVQLDDAGLEAKGVAAVGARRKMLKVFEQVREARADGKL